MARSPAPPPMLTSRRYDVGFSLKPLADYLLEGDDLHVCNPAPSDDGSHLCAQAPRRSRLLIYGGGAALGVIPVILFVELIVALSY